MSKFLKVIVNLFLVFAILVAGAILVPPILGVSTTMIDSASIDTNLPVGSITYSQNESVANVVAGDQVLIENDNRVYVYVVESADAVTGKFVVTDELGDKAESEEITLRNEVLKVVLTVPLIGYIMVAMHSVEGLIIIGLVVLFVIILFILSELWKKSDEDDEEGEDEDAASELDSADAVEVTVADALLDGVEEVVVQDDCDVQIQEAVIEEAVNDELVQVQEEFEDAAAESEEDVLTEEESEEAAEEAEEALETAAEEPVEELEKADTFVKIPRPTLEEVLVKAEQAGDTPEIISYDEFGITVVDFSKCI